MRISAGCPRHFKQLLTSNLRPVVWFSVFCKTASRRGRHLNRKWRRWSTKRTGLYPAVIIVFLPLGPRRIPVPSSGISSKCVVTSHVRWGKRGRIPKRRLVISRSMRSRELNEVSSTWQPKSGSVWFVHVPQNKARQTPWVTGEPPQPDPLKDNRL